MTVTDTPQGQVAQNYMIRKGYRGYYPIDIQELDGVPCWYFLYQLDEGLLELEVFWNDKKQEWETMVTSFTLAEQ